MNEKKDLKKMTDKELFDYLEENLKKSTKKNAAEKLINTMKEKEKLN